jgi:hypothetical protein
VPSGTSQANYPDEIECRYAAVTVDLPLGPPSASYQPLNAAPAIKGSPLCLGMRNLIDRGENSYDDGH